MTLPFDIEDIVGAGCWDAICRGFAAISCVWVGCATGVAGHHTAALVERLATGTSAGWGFGPWLYALGPLVLVASIFLPLAFPLVIACYFTFVRSDEGGGVKWWIAYCAAWGLLVVLCLTPWGDLTSWSALPFFLWIGWVGTFAFVAWMVAVWQRRKFAEHLIELEAENDARRQQLRDEFGTAHADREWATGKRHLWQEDPPE